MFVLWDLLVHHSPLIVFAANRGTGTYVTS